MFYWRVFCDIYMPKAPFRFFQRKGELNKNCKQAQKIHVNF